LTCWKGTEGFWLIFTLHRSFLRNVLVRYSCIRRYSNKKKKLSTSDSLPYGRYVCSSYYVFLHMKIN